MPVGVGGVRGRDVESCMRCAADGLYPEAMRIDDLEQRLARGHHLTGAHVGHGDDAADGRFERNALGIFRSQHALLLAQGIELGACVVDILLRDDAGDARTGALASARRS